MAKLFDVLAGKSDDTFKIGGVEFYAAPLTITEWGQLNRLSDAELLAFLAEKLQARVKEPTKNPPSEIRPEWVRDNLPQTMMGTLQYVLMYGKMPDEDEKK